MAHAAAHLADHVIPPVSVWQWVISLPKRLRCFRADRPEAVASLTRIFLTRVERLLIAAVGATCDDDAPRAARPQLGDDLPPVNGTTSGESALPSDTHLCLGLGFGRSACVCMANAWAARIVRTLAFIA